jgi:2-dehydropantoate 2-reductase
MQQNGLRVESPLGEILLRQVSATETPADVGFVDIVVFAVKAYDTESAAAAIVPLVGPTTRVVTLQNGVDSVDAVARIVPRSQVVGGTTYLAALIERPGVIVHLGSVTRVIVGGRDDARRGEAPASEPAASTWRRSTTSIRCCGPSSSRSQPFRARPA